MIVGGGVKVAGGLSRWRTLTTSHANENDLVERGKLMVHEGRGRFLEQYLGIGVKG